MNKVGSFFRELRRRGVLQTAVMYIVGAWVLLQAANVLFPGAEIPDSAIKFVFGGTVLGFPLVMVFGWMYDITGQGIHRTPSSQQAGRQGLPLRRFDFVFLSGLATLTVALVIGVSAKVMNEANLDSLIAQNQPAAENSVAVLPFVNLSDDSDNDYFGDGIAEEILNQLANLTSLQVAARTSSYFFKGKNAPMQSIGKQLGVRTILEGSVRKSGDRIRVTAQLINAADGYHLWSETFDRELNDVFAIQEDIARAITAALEVEIQGKESRRLAAVPTESFDAYDYYLLGQHYREARNPESLEKSIELFELALELDDRFALGYAALALSYLYQAYYAGLAPERVKELTDPLIERSLELDPLLAKAHATRASVRLLLRDFLAADAGYRKALELQPNYSGAWSNLGYSMVLQSRLEEAAQFYDKSEALDPLNATMQFNIGALRMLTGRYDDGLDAFKETLRLAPERTLTEQAIVHWSIAYGRYDEAVQWIGRVLEREPDSSSVPTYVGRIYSNLGMWEESWSALSWGSDGSTENMASLERVADYYFVTGDHAGLNRFVDKEYQKIDRLAPTEYSPTNKSRYYWHGLGALLEGNYVQAIDDFTDAGGGKEGIANAVYDEISVLKYLAYAYQMQGRDDEAILLLTNCLDLASKALEQGWATPAIHYRTAQVHALLGDADNAVAQLQQALDKGWRIAAILERDPLWSSMQDDTRFQTIIVKVNDDLRLIRESVASSMRDLPFSASM